MFALLHVARTPKKKKGTSWQCNGTNCFYMYMYIIGSYSLLSNFLIQNILISVSTTWIKKSIWNNKHDTSLGLRLKYVQYFSPNQITPSICMDKNSIVITHSLTRPLTSKSQSCVKSSTMNQGFETVTWWWAKRSVEMKIHKGENPGNYTKIVQLRQPERRLEGPCCYFNITSNS